MPTSLEKLLHVSMWALLVCACEKAHVYDSSYLHLTHGYRLAFRILRTKNGNFNHTISQLLSWKSLAAYHNGQSCSSIDEPSNEILNYDTLFPKSLLHNHFALEMLIGRELVLDMNAAIHPLNRGAHLIEENSFWFQFKLLRFNIIFQRKLCIVIHSFTRYLSKSSMSCSSPYLNIIGEFSWVFALQTGEFTISPFLKGICEHECYNSNINKLES